MLGLEKSAYISGGEVLHHGAKVQIATMLKIGSYVESITQAPVPVGCCLPVHDDNPGELGRIPKSGRWKPVTNGH